MAADSARLSSRTTTVLAVAAAHGLVVWLIWRVELPLPPELETFTSLLFWAPAAEPVRPSSAIHPRVAATRAPRPPSLRPAPAPDSGTAIPVPATPGAPVDWRAALSGAAAAQLDKEKRTGEQVRALTRKYAVPDDPRDPHPGPSSSFRWYEAGIHRIDTRALIPGLWVNDHCVLIAFVMPFCKIGHIEIHGDLFDGAAAVHDEKLATPRPNDVP
jgi:hypothetical protein